MTSALLDAILVLLGVAAAPFFVQGVIRSRTRTGRILKVVAGFAVITAFLFVWARFGLDPLQMAYCAVDQKARMCIDAEEPITAPEEAGADSTVPRLETQTAPRPARPQANTTPFDLSLLNPNVRQAVDTARTAAARGVEFATRGRAAASQGEDALRAANEQNGCCIIRRFSGAQYAGQQRDGELTGYGSYLWDTGDRYSGEFHAGDRTGFGVYYYARTDNIRTLRYEGEFRNDMKEGYGSVIWRTEGRYTGQMEQDHPSGFGIRYFADGRRYEGQLANSQAEGYGAYWDEDGRLLSQAQFAAGEVVTRY